jgi:succinate dehydrogenase / fumarate reductase, membrane anchor subunit
VVKREVIGAHYGTFDWLAQRVTAVVMAVYTIFFLIVLVRLIPLDYERWSALWRLPVMRYATLFFVVSMLYHAWVGVRNIFMDYAQHVGVRLVLDVVAILALIGYGMWSVQILWGF